jgi:hypothetical protein
VKGKIVAFGMVLLKALIVEELACTSLEDLNRWTDYSGKLFVTPTDVGPCDSVINIVPLVYLIMTGVIPFQYCVDADIVWLITKQFVNELFDVV